MRLVHVLAMVSVGVLTFLLWPETNQNGASLPFVDHLSTIDSIMDQWRNELGDAYPGYRAHCYRVYHFMMVLLANGAAGAVSGVALTPEQEEMVQVAVAHHDIGIWTDPHDDGVGNLDYLAPSVKRALEYLAAAHKPSNWSRPVELMIAEHHKLTTFTKSHLNAPDNGQSSNNNDAHTDIGTDTSGVSVEQLVELVRQADLVDFSLGMVRCGLTRSLVSDVQTHWPNAGFHPAQCWFSSGPSAFNRTSPGSQSTQPAAHDEDVATIFSNKSFHTSIHPTSSGKMYILVYHIDCIIIDHNLNLRIPI